MTALLLKETLIYHHAWLITLALLGLILGSFCAVVIDRFCIILTGQTPFKKFNLIHPGSHCPSCLHPLAWRLLMPVLSFVLLRGRCAYCQARIDPRTPLIEVVIAAGVVALGCCYPFDVQLIARIYFFCLMVVLSFIDLRTLYLPDALTLSGLWLGLLWSATPYAWVHSHLAILGAALGYSLLWCTNYAYFAWRKVHGMGGGDFKLLALIGAWLGLANMLNAFFVAIFSGAIAALLCMTLGKKNRQHAIPFGPFLALGALITSATGPQLITWWLS